jgi:SAM-dependent methyltransferase
VIVAELAPPGSVAPAQRLPIMRPGVIEGVATLLGNAIYQELIGPRTFGALLNVGAGTESDAFEHGKMFAVDEYHTQEIEDSEVDATYKCDGEDMSVVPSDRYDWVISSSVLEHVPDPWAAAREQMRITKPGGYILTRVPFACVMHLGHNYGDLWRFSPMGVAKLFTGCELTEVILFGETPHLPYMISVVMRKGGAGLTPRYYWLDMPNDFTWNLIFPQTVLPMELPLYDLLVEPMNLALQLNNAKNQLTRAIGVNVSQRDVARGLMGQYTRLRGVLGFAPPYSFFRPAPS